MKILLTLMILLLVCSVNQAQERKTFDHQFWVFTAIYAGGATADIVTSRKANLFETNPMLRGSDGRVSIGRAIGFAAVPYALSLLLQKHHPKAASVLRLAGGSAHIGAAVMNANQKWRL